MPVPVLQRIAAHKPGETWFASVPGEPFSGLLWVSRAPASSAWFYRTEVQDPNLDIWAESAPGTPYDSRDEAIAAAEMSLRELTYDTRERWSEGNR